MSEELPPGLVFSQPKRGRPPKDGVNQKQQRKKKKAQDKRDLERPPQSTKTEYKGPATPRAEEKKGIFEGEKRAVDVAFHWADVEPAEEKQWVIDQMLRSMLGGLGYRDYREQYQKEWEIEWDQGKEPEWENEEEYDEPNDKQQEYESDDLEPGDTDDPEDKNEDKDDGNEDDGSDSNGESNEDEVPF